MSFFLNTKRKIFLFLAGTLFLLNLFAWQEVFALAETDFLEINFLDVGQGDSIFIKTPLGHQILIDGGPNSAVLQKLSGLMPIFDKSLDVVLLTHTDSDHLMGLIHVLKKYKIDYVIWTGIDVKSGNYAKWLDLVEQKQKEGTKVIIADLSTKVRSGKVLIDTLNPTQSLRGENFKKSNDTGIVSRLLFGQNSFLFTADISSKVEQEMVRRGFILSADILKIPHHGSKYSSSEEFLQSVSPEIAVISAGKNNSYGHPTPEVLQRLEKFGISILRTDKDGDIQIISDGNNIKVNR